MGEGRSRLKPKLRLRWSQGGHKAPPLSSSESEPGEVAGSLAEDGKDLQEAPRLSLWGLFGA